MKKGLKLATPQDFRAPPAEAGPSELGSAASIGATVHALDPIQDQEGLATSAALAKRAVYEARSSLNVPDGDGMLLFAAFSLHLQLSILSVKLTRHFAEDHMSS